jgi:[ribosomal protein S18]-alanine N-acetyltransferase
MRAAEAADFAALEAGDRPYPWTADQFLSTRPPAEVLVWEENGAMRGYAAVQVIGDEAYLLNLMVPPALRRRGFGGSLLQKVMMVARERGARWLMLDVAADNAAALRLYERFGLSQVERRRGAYPRGEDALLMKKDL